MKEKIDEIIERLEGDYDYYLEKSEDINYRANWSIIEQRLHDLKIEINTYKNVLEMLENEEILSDKAQGIMKLLDKSAILETLGSDKE